MKNDPILFDNLINSYVDSSNKIESDFLPSFIYNKTDRDDIKQVKDTIVDNLRKCDEFIFSVAFITAGGLAILKEYLRELEEKGIKGKILTTNYLRFTDPKALRDISNFKNIELKMFYVDENNTVGFHTKGYIFRFGENYKAIIGSSNITQDALTINNEWNNQIISTKHGTIIKEILSDFDRIRNEAISIDKIIDKYEEKYVVEFKKIKLDDNPVIKIFKPNAMQIAVMNELNVLIDRGEKRGLLISATGTGKTYASAFAVSSINKFKVKKLLFVTHRETILSQAIKTYNNIFGDKIKTALLTGNSKDIEGANFIFATVNTIREKKIYESFKKDEFDFIIIDEVHKVGDNLYQNIINYF
jgi:HKD family nuclease